MERASPPHDPIPEATRAVRALLVALGAPVDADPELQGTPERVARAFHEELLEGYRTDPAAVLAEALPSHERGLVVLTEVTYQSVCPHHLLPSWGVAHVAYLPGGRIVGLGAIVRLVECLARRLVLQESLGRQIADGLVQHLGARAAGAVLDARHACLSARGERQSGARMITQSFAGLWESDVAARGEFLHAITLGRQR